MEEIQQTPAGPKTTVLIVSHNTVEALRRALATLMNTTSRETVEVLVVDKCSRDGSGQLDAEFPEARFLRLERNFGFTRAVNIGTRTAQGDYLLLLDPYVEIDGKAIAALEAVLDADETVVAACPLLVSDKGDTLTRLRPVASGGDLLRAWKAGESGGKAPADLDRERIAAGWPPRAAVLVRKQFIRGMNFLDQRFGEFGGDLEVFFQIARSGKKAWLLPGVKVPYRPLPLELPVSAAAQLSADEALGISVFGARHGGFLEGLGLRLSAIFHVFFKLVTFQEAGYQLDRLMALVSGQKIDGTQGSI